MYRTHRVSPICIGLVAILAGAVAAQAEDPTTRPAQATAAATTTQPVGMPQMGVVRQALTQLYVVPRNGPAPLPGSSRATKKSTSHPAYAGPPTITVERDTEMIQRPSQQATGSVPGANGQVKGNAAPNASSDPGDARPVATVAIECTPWSRTGPNISSKDREWADYRYYGGTPSRYGVGMYSPGGYGYDNGGTYRFGFMEGYDYGRFDAATDARVEALMSHASVQIDRGVQYFRKGQYQQAADTFQLAAETDQGDSVSRIYAGHSLFALGRYRDAVRYLRRAFELQPRVAYLTYDIRGDYENQEVFAEQITALGKALDLAPRDPDRLFLMGYLHYYTGQRTQAFRYFVRAVEVNRNDAIADRLMRNAQPPDVELDGVMRADQQRR